MADNIAALGQPSEVAVSEFHTNFAPGNGYLRVLVYSHVRGGASEPSSTSLAIFAVCHEVSGDSEVVGKTAATDRMDDRHALYINLLGSPVAIEEI
jgi:hypothetical protein